MGSTGKAGQLRASLGDHDLGDAPSDTGDRLEYRSGLLFCFQTRGNLVADALDERLQALNVRQLLGDQKLLVRRKVAGERLLQLGDLLPHAPLCQLCQRRRIRGPTQPEHAASHVRISPECLSRRRPI